tara:strand:+ start:53 stop:757 length:705 start_codon:yes stop_codon:yes gene_type:complete
MMNSKSWWCSALAILFGVSGLVGESHGAENDVARTRVVCFGDSITAGAYPDLLGEMDGRFEIISAGVGGNTTGAGLKRMETDVLAKDPDVVLIMFGTNDSVLRGPKQYRTPGPAFKENLQSMVDQCREKGATPILATLLPIMETPYYTRHPKEYYDPDGGLQAIVARYRAITIALAEELKVPVVDMNQLIAGDETHLKPDGVHPNGAGEKAIATHFLDALNALSETESKASPKP